MGPEGCSYHPHFPGPAPCPGSDPSLWGAPLGQVLQLLPSLWLEVAEGVSSPPTPRTQRHGRAELSWNLERPVDLGASPSVGSPEAPSLGRTVETSTCTWGAGYEQAQPLAETCACPVSELSAGIHCHRVPAVPSQGPAPFWAHSHHSGSAAGWAGHSGVGAPVPGVEINAGNPGGQGGEGALTPWS